MLAVNITTIYKIEVFQFFFDWNNFYENNVVFD
jgi:hypothetical protein